MQRVQFSTGLSTVLKHGLSAFEHSDYGRCDKYGCNKPSEFTCVSANAAAEMALWFCNCYLWTGASLAELYRHFFVRLCVYVVSLFSS